MKNLNLLCLLTALATLVSISERANAQLPGQTLKFQQLPLNNALPPGSVNGAPYPGHDEWSTARAPQQPQPFDFAGTFMADDFADTVNTPVVHVRWWGSYENNFNESLAQKFLITFETDVPFDPQVGGSRPGTPLLSQIVTQGPLSPGSGTFTESLVNPAVAEHLWEYRAELAVPFPQMANTVYWLKIVALNDPAIDGGPFNWGWHNRDYTQQNLLASTPPTVSPGEDLVGGIVDTTGQTLPIWHFQDDAVTGQVLISANAAGIQVGQSQYASTNYIYQYLGTPGIDGPVGIENYSKDLAFELYTIVPEPAAVVLAGAGAFGLGVSIWKRRRRSLVG